jgi:4-hydroxythreonine-4-phosphate dehydrogenase
MTEQESEITPPQHKERSAPPSPFKGRERDQNRSRPPQDRQVDRNQPQRREQREPNREQNRERNRDRDRRDPREHRTERYERPERDDKPLIGITMGDVGGIGPELILKVFSDPRVLDHFSILIYGSVKALNYYRQILKFDKFHFTPISSANQAHARKINVLEVNPQFDRVEIGVADARAGSLAFSALEKATQHLLEGRIHALVTLPINKATIQNPNFSFPGHTEYLTARFKDTESLMMMVHENLRVAVVTGHIPLKDVSSAIKVDTILSKLYLMEQSLKLDFNIEKPIIAVLGLNPHAGENGLLGKEEQETIRIALDIAREKGMLVFGCYPADGFFTSKTYRKFDGVLAMYHDQGLIPFKVLSQGEGVNFTAGLKFVRTSPDHGTAYDIAGKKQADETSFRNALYLAVDVFRNRTDNQALQAGAIRNISIKEFTSGEDSILTDEG